jgi:hypothetical protein
MESELLCPFANSNVTKELNYIIMMMTTLFVISNIVGKQIQLTLAKLREAK